MSEFESLQTITDVCRMTMRGARTRANKLEPRSESLTLERGSNIDSGIHTFVRGQQRKSRSGEFSTKIETERPTRPRGQPANHKRLVFEVAGWYHPRLPNLNTNDTSCPRTALCDANTRRHNGTTIPNTTEKLHNTVAMTVAAHETENHMMQSTFAGQPTAATEHKINRTLHCTQPETPQNQI